MLTTERKIEVLKNMIVIIQLPNVQARKWGICHSIPDDIEDWWQKQRPNIFNKFFWNKHYQIFDIYWWTRDKGGYEQRVKYLNYLIKKLEKNDTTNRITYFSVAYWTCYNGSNVI